MIRITQLDVAKSLRMHVTTVSKALRGHPDIAATTRRRILEAADRLGYVPDPLLAALAAYRSARRPPAFQSVIGWICNHSSLVKMGDFAGYADYFLGAQARAQQLGYQLDRFFVADIPGGLARLVRMLEARNVRGLIIAPQAGQRVAMEGVPWDRFAAVTIGLTLIKPRLHAVTNDHFHTAYSLIQELRARGYRRIGCYVRWRDDARIEGRFASVLVSELRAPKQALRIYDESDREDFLEWYTARRFEAVITGERQVVTWLRKAGVSVPGVCGVAQYALPSNEELVSGMDHNNTRIGSAAVDLVTGLLHRGETGPPDLPLRTMVPCRWIEGRTLIERGRAGRF